MTNFQMTNRAMMDDPAYRATLDRFWRTPADEDADPGEPTPDATLQRRIATRRMIDAIRRIPKEESAA